MSRPLLVIFLTILVNLIGFGIIIPLLPFYAETFGASPFVVGMLFASFSIAQLVASPVLGHWSDHWGRRPVLIFSLLGTVVSFVMLALAHSLTLLFIARVVDGLSGGNITTARAYIGDVTDESNRAKVWHARRVVRPSSALGPAIGVFAKISYAAPIWAAALITLGDQARVVCSSETAHRVHAAAGSPWKRDISMPGAANAVRDRLSLTLLRDLSGTLRCVSRSAFGSTSPRSPRSSRPSACSA
jgi:MFS family permease